MKKTALFGIAAITIGLSGCAQVDSFMQNQVIDPMAAMFQNPNTKIVVNGLELTAQIVAQDTQALACIIAAGTAVAGQVEANPAFNAGASLQGTNMKLQVASSATCNNLQGILKGKVTVPAGGTVIQ